MSFILINGCIGDIDTQNLNLNDALRSPRRRGIILYFLENVLRKKTLCMCLVAHNYLTGITLCLGLHQVEFALRAGMVHEICSSL